MTQTSSRSFKDDAFSHLERIGKALGNRRRLELLDLVSQGPRTVEQLATELAVSVAVASQHLQKLKKARLVVGDRVGTHVYYRVASDDVADLYATLRNLARARLPGLRETVDDFFGDSGVGDDDAIVEKIRRGEAVLIDTRPAEEFHSAHVAGALSVPVDELADRLDELPRDQTLVAHCRGPFCTFADRAVRTLRDDGFDAVRLDFSVADFRRHDLPIVTAEAS